MRTNTEQKTQMDTKGSDVGSGFTADPEDTKVPLVVELVKLAFVNCPDTKLTLNSRDQWRPLEKSSSQCLESPLKLGLTTRDLIMEADNANVFFSGTLLGFHQASGTVNADNQATGDLGVEGSAVTSLLRPLQN